MSGTDQAAGDKGVSLSEKAYRLLRQKILRGEIPPEEKLKIETLQRVYALSSSPLREALNRLLAEGLVTADDHRGFRAAAMSVADLRDITEFRLLIEPIALQESIRRGNDEWEAKLLAAFHRLERTEGRLDPAERAVSDEWTERHKSFHMTLIGGCSSFRMVQTCSGLYDLAERYRRYSAAHRKEPRNTAAEHKQLMDAALTGDAERAKQLLRDHVGRTAENVIANMNQSN